MKTPRNLIILTAAALALVAAASVVSIVRGAAARLQKLPDGSTLRLEAVTYGRVHQVVYGSWWTRPLAPYLKPNVRASLGCGIASLASPDPGTLVLWTRRDGGTGRVDWEPNTTRAVVLDAHGGESETGRLCYRQMLPADWSRLEAWRIPAFPRRGKSVGLRIDTRASDGRWVRTATFTVPNPTPGPHPVWTPQPLPITRLEGDAQFTLTELTTGVRPSDSPRRAAANEEAWSCATFRATGTGDQYAAWVPVGITLSDASGNRFKPLVRLQRRPDGETRLYFLGTLWPDEAAWRLRVEFAPAAALAPDRLCTVHGQKGAGQIIPPPPGGTRPHRLWKFTARPPSLQVHGIISVDAFRQGGVMVMSSTPSVLVSAAVPPKERLTLVRATHDRDREVPVSEALPDGPGRFKFTLGVPPGVQTLDLAFALHTSRYVEFVAAPFRLSGDD